MADRDRRVLVIDDEPHFRLAVRATLTAYHYLVIEAKSGYEGLAKAADEHPDVLLLDIGLPDVDGFEVLRRLRRVSDVPTIVFSARGNPNDVATALEAGATDFLAKPFEPAELLSRIQMALLKPDGDTTSGMISNFGDLHIDWLARRVFKQKVEVNLTPIEFELLTVFVRNPGKLLTYQRLFAELAESPSSRRSELSDLKTAISGLRRKVEIDPVQPLHVQAELGIGYRFVP